MIWTPRPKKLWTPERKRRVELHGRMLMGYGGGAAAPAFVVDAADFDGTNDALNKTTLTGQAASKQGILSLWFRADALADDSVAALFNGEDTAIGNDFFSLYLFTVGSDRRIFFEAASDSPFTPQLLNGSTSGPNDWNLNTWTHLLFSWDGATTTGHFYINDVSFGLSVQNENIRWNEFDEHNVCQFSDDSGRFNGGLAELYFAPGQYLDFSVEANRRKFISAGLKPVDLGAGGATPTGTQPRVYQHLDNAEAAANFAVNAGTGGNWTVVGALSTYASSPSD